MSSTLTPFLYQTRTLQRVLRARPAVSFANLLHTSPRLQQPRNTKPNPNDSIPFQFDGSLNSADNPPEIPTTLRQDGQELSTITPSEERVFSDIFADIANNGVKPKKSGARSGSKDTETDLSHSDSLNRQEALLDVIKDATLASTSKDRIFSGKFMDISPAPSLVQIALERDGSQRNSRQRQMMLHRFPASLRHAAEAALALHKTGESTHDRQAGAHPDLPVRWGKEQAVRDAEQGRVANMMAECNTDVELWDVLEREVFSMPDKLGIKSNSAGQVESRANSTIPLKPIAPSRGAAKLRMEIHGPLYSVHLLEAIQVLSKGFLGAASPLALQLLPRVKELGLESYVLGASTPFYNELMTIYWDQYGDLNGVLQLLREMDHAGLFFDAKTATLLRKIETNLADLEGGKFGGLAKAIVGMPEYDVVLRHRLQRWLSSFENWGLMDPQREAMSPKAFLSY
jgi:hypothetical protein